MVTVPVKHAPNSAEVARTCLKKKKKKKQKKKIGGYFNRLPCEILHKIALMLPFSSIKHLRSSSKFWYNLLTDPEFVNLHFTCALQKPPGSLFTASCKGSRRKKLNCYFLEQSGDNLSTSKIFEYSDVCWFRCLSSGGLICVYSSESNCFRVFNPDIREVVQVSDFPKPENWFALESWLFGYSPSTKEYKILEISTLHGGSKPGFFTVGAITTLGSNIWRDIQDVPPDMSIKSTTECQGNLFWIDTYGSNVVSFDLVSEKFHEIPGPPRDVTYKSIRSVNSFRETLVSMSHTVGYVKDDRLWVLEDKIKGIWINMYNFSVPSLDRHHRFIVISENGGLFGHIENSINVFSHDMGSTDFRLMKMILDEPRGIVAPSQVWYIAPHVRSFVSPVRIMENGSQSNS